MEVDILDLYISAIKNYVNFNGRARRNEYWTFWIINIIFLIIAAMLDNMLITTSLDMEGPFVSLYSLFIFLPSISILFRRLHDIGKSGWWLLLLLIPLIGEIVIFIFTLISGDTGTNAYGADPKEIPKTNNQNMY